MYNKHYFSPLLSSQSSSSFLNQKKVSKMSLQEKAFLGWACLWIRKAALNTGCLCVWPGEWGVEPAWMFSTVEWLWMVFLGYTAVLGLRYPRKLWEKEKETQRDNLWPQRNLILATKSPILVDFHTSIKATLLELLRPKAWHHPWLLLQSNLHSVSSFRNWYWFCLLSISGLIKLIHLLRPTKWRLFQWPGPCHKSKPKPASTYGKKH